MKEQAYGSRVSCSVIIPTLNAGEGIGALAASLQGQTVVPKEILVIDSGSSDDTASEAEAAGCRVTVISRSEFNHGGTRNRAARAVTGDVLVFMTQDAVPVDRFFLENLLEPIRSGRAAGAFARQTAYEDAPACERFARAFNYPLKSELRTRSDILKLGVKAYFFSNVASAVRRDVFFELGMFAEDVIMNEDMLLCADLLENGHGVAYAAEAVVLHSHNYGLGQVFRRYFDIGVFFAGHLSGKPGLDTTGREARIPVRVKRVLSMHSFYWERR